MVFRQNVYGKDMGNSMEYKASIIIPVFNAEKTLRRCVESLALGLEKNIEIIMVDDCSVDDSWTVCCELKEEFNIVEIFKNEQNSGVSYTRNRGLEVARGKYVLFVDSDDWVSGKYVRDLVRVAEDNPDALSICGHIFIDKVHFLRQKYIWNDSSDVMVEVSIDHLFELSDKFLLQHLWNKIFVREQIERNSIRFDENQSMGEDFQFVLDYLEKADLKKCAIINKPLYYYVRWNEGSLISNYGIVQNQQEFDRIKKMTMISGADSDVYEAAISKLKRNYIYHLSRNKKLSRKEKTFYINRITNNEKSSLYLREQELLQIKENFRHIISKAFKIPDRVAAKCHRLIIDYRINKVKNSITDPRVSIISQNCIGGVVYHDLHSEFLSPTINLFFKEPDFVKFVLNLHHYLNCDLIMSWGDEYPIGKIEDLTVFFMHYDNCKEAKLAWERRKVRINWEKIIVLSTDHEGFDFKVFAEWKKVPYTKVLFTSNVEFAGDRDSVFFPEYRDDKCVPDLIPKREFYKNDELITKINGL